MKKLLQVRNFIGSKLLKNSFLLNGLYNRFYLLRNKRRFITEVKRREKLSIFDYIELSQELPFCPLEFIKDSNFYGYAYSIKKYADIDSLNRGCSIEHGLYYEDNYIPSAAYSRTTKQIVTLSNVRKNLLDRNLKKKTIAIGPYIHYAESLLSKECKISLKNKYGKILLFFPSHGSVEDKETYDIERMICKLNNIKEKFNCDTVFVNMFYYDVLYTEYVELYDKAGFVITTAGHRYDLNFISRLKSIIELSDIVVSNKFGTNVGYSIYMKKPTVILDGENVNKESMVAKVCSVLHYVSDEILPDQYEIVSKYWGFDCVRTPEELNKILLDVS